MVCLLQLHLNQVGIRPSLGRIFDFPATLGKTLLIFLLLSSGCGREGMAGPLADTIVEVKPSIVGVGTFQRTRSPPGQFRGTGFVISDGLTIVTNAHVLPQTLDSKQREFLAVFGREGQKNIVRGAKIIASDDKHDIAILKISGNPLSAMRLGESKKVREGELYAFTGFPIGVVLGLHPVTHRGIVSAISPIVIPSHTSRQLNPQMIRRLGDPYDVFQLDATAYPGNSGSPLYELETGRVVGIINKVFVKETKENILQKPSGISYAIPIKYVRELIKRSRL